MLPCRPQKTKAKRVHYAIIRARAQGVIFRRGIDLTHRRSFRGVCTLRPKSPVATTKVPGLYDQTPRSLEPFDARLLGCLTRISWGVRRASLGVCDARRMWRPNGEFCYVVGGVLYPKGAIMELKTLRGSWPCAFAVLRHGNNVLLERKAGEKPLPNGRPDR